MQTLFSGVIGDIIINISAGIILFIAGILATHFYDWIRNKRPVYKIWGFNNEEEICVVTGNIRRGIWKRLMASGDIRAYGEVVSTLRSNYKKDLIAEFFSAEFHPSQYKRSNIVSVGGPIWNWVTEKTLEELDHPFEFDTDGECLIDKRVTPEKKYLSLIEKDVKEDYGVIIKVSNPYRDDKNILVFMGYTTYGVLAAARCLSDLHEYILGKRKLRNKFLNTKCFSVVVKARIIRDPSGEEDVVPEIIEDSFLEFPVAKPNPKGRGCLVP